MRSAVVVDVLRTPFGRRGGMLAAQHPADLLGRVLDALAIRNGLGPTAVGHLIENVIENVIESVIEDVIVGCVMQIGAQSLNVGRAAVLAAGWPHTVSAATVDRQGASGQQALHIAAQGVAAGAYDVAVAAGVEIMSLVPMGASVSKGLGLPFGPRVTERYRDQGGLVPLGLGAELLAERTGISREAMDHWAGRSRQRALRAQDQGWLGADRMGFDGFQRPGRRSPRTLEVPASDRDGDRDELVGSEPGGGEDGALLKPGWREDGRVTAGNSAPIADGAGAVLIMSEERAEQLGLRPRARFVAFATAGSDPLRALEGPVPATEVVLARAGLRLADIDAFEVHEDFAVTVLAWLAAVGADPELVNANGGALAFGDPVGASGLRLTGSLLGQLERGGGRYGLQTMAGSGGVATAMILERLG
ncbi:MAG: thiolase family protein [Acidimicrobiales bacterium]